MILDKYFENRVVAFLDVLGFSDLIKRIERDRQAESKFIGLRNVIESHVRFDKQKIAASVPDEAKPRYLFISDSIIISSPVQKGSVDGLASVLVKTLQVSHKLLEMGFLLRGGISLGRIWHDEHNIYGQAYIEAAKLEQSVGIPAVILSPSAAEHLDSTDVGGVPLRELSLCRRVGNSWHAELLHPYYVRDPTSGIPLENYYSQYRAHIYAQLQSLATGTSARSKWEYFAVEFNRAIRVHGINIDPIESFPFPDEDDD